MDETFNKLIQRGTFKQQKTIGEPWDAIPIKNRKQAKECIQIHMANRSLQGIKDFEHFPNLEVLYLNDNKIEVLEGLDANFRIKNLYMFNNQLNTMQGSLEYLQHLEILVLYNNELRDLDKTIEFLKRYTNLKQLDLFKNPLCEEPNYRLRVIYNLPQIRLLDRHLVTYDERQKAIKLIESDDFRKRKKDIKKRILPSQMFSQSERDLYKDADKIKRAQQKKIDDEIQLQQTIRLEKIKKQAEMDANKVPRSKFAIQMEKRRQIDPHGCITEFEKDKIRKLFRQFDKEKKAQISKDDLGNLYNELIEDNGIIGLVPDCTLEEFIQIINPDDKDIVEHDTYSFNLNMIYWTKPNIEKTEQRIKQYYKSANQKINRGNRPDACEDLNLAIRLQNKLSLDQNHIVHSEQKKQQSTDVRFDSFDFGRFTFKKTFSNTAKTIL